MPNQRECGWRPWRFLDNLRLGRLNDDGLWWRLHNRGSWRTRRVRWWRGTWSLILNGDILLLVAFQVPRLLGALAHDLHGVHHVLGNVEIGVSKGRSPRQACCHLIQHIGKLGEAFDTDIPRLLVGSLYELTIFEARILLEPGIRGCDFIGIHGGREDLCDQIIGKERDRRDELIELIGGRNGVGRGGSLSL